MAANRKVTVSARDLHVTTYSVGALWKRVNQLERIIANLAGIRPEDIKSTPWRQQAGETGR